MDERDLELVAAEWEANLLARERVPELATALLEEGYDTPTRRVAAGLLPSELDEAHTLFGRALAELGYQRQRDWRGHGEALAREYARRGLDGRMPLVEAVGGVCNLSLRFEREDWSLDGMSMKSLLALADEWEDEPKKRPAIEDDMRRELQRFSERRS